MKTNYDCVACIIRQALDAVRQVTEDEQIIESVLRSALSTASEIDYDQTPVEIGRLIHRKIREETGNPDPYLAIKNKANKAAKGLMPFIRKKVECSQCPFATAVRYAIAGNILDFALYTSWDNAKFKQSMGIAETKEIDIMQLHELDSKVKKAKSILLLGDNAGEVIFDRILLEQMPAEKLYYAVKGEPVINDVLRADAEFAGIDKVAEIISNGTDSAGTLLSACTQEFLDIFNNIDLVIAKGQANFETLIDCEREVYFLTQIKCKIIARDLNGAVGDWVVTSNKHIR